MSPLFIYYVGSSRNFLIHYSNMCIYIFMCTDAGMRVTLKLPSSQFLCKFCASSEVTVNTLGKQGLRINKGCMQGVPQLVWMVFPFQIHNLTPHEGILHTRSLGGD